MSNRSRWQLSSLNMQFLRASCACMLLLRLATDPPTNFSTLDDSCPVVLLMTYSFPAAVFCYWTSSNMFSLTQTVMLKNDSVRVALGIPEKIGSSLNGWWRISFLVSLSFRFAITEFLQCIQSHSFENVFDSVHPEVPGEKKEEFSFSKMMEGLKDADKAAKYTQGERINEVKASAAKRLAEHRREQRRLERRKKKK